MTSRPLWGYAGAGYERPKDLTKRGGLFDQPFLKSPLLYQIGINRECCSLSLLLKWVVYGLFHAYIVYEWCFKYITDTPQGDGKDIGFWVAGLVVYGACCLIANLILVHKFNLIDHVQVVFVALMVIAYFLFFALESISGWFPEVNHIFSTTFSIPIVWLGLLLTLGASSAIEFGDRYWTEIIMKLSKEELRASSLERRKLLYAHSDTSSSSQLDELPSSQINHGV